MEYKPRQTAYKIKIKDVVDGEFIKEESGSFVKSSIGNVSRVNVIGIVISNEPSEYYGGAIIDDGTERISARSFENKEVFQEFNIGDTVNIIGRVRVYAEQKYIAIEIITPVKKEWLEHRKKELEVLYSIYKKNIEPEQKETSNIKEEVVMSKEEVSGVEKICNLIKELDSGDGVDMQEVITKSSDEKCEQIISELLKNGDIFEIRPGRIKILE